MTISTHSKKAMPLVSPPLSKSSQVLRKLKTKRRMRHTTSRDCPRIPIESFFGLNPTQMKNKCIAFRKRHLLKE